MNRLLITKNLVMFGYCKEDLEKMDECQLNELWNRYTVSDDEARSIFEQETGLKANKEKQNIITKGMLTLDDIPKEIDENIKKDFSKICNYSNSKKGIVDKQEFDKWCLSNQICKEAINLYLKF